MSVFLNKFSISAGYEFIATHAANVAKRIGYNTFNIFDDATTFVGQFLPNLRPTSVGEVVLQAKKNGCALLSTQEGDYLITITLKKGRYIFQATSEMFEPVVFYEGKKCDSGAIWEVKISNYLQHIVKKSFSVTYGDVAKRWKGDAFTELKDKFSTEGLLRKIGNDVMLKLPGDEPLIFKAPYANLKAEISLKRYYQFQKTPIEEELSKPWDLVKRLFVGYLYFSGFALSPWVHNHVHLSHQRAEMEEENAQRMAADGYLDVNELREMVRSSTLRQRVMDIAEFQAEQGKGQLLSQLQDLRFESNGYTQAYQYEGKRIDESHYFSLNKEIHSRTVCTDSGFCEEYIMEQSSEQLILTNKTHTVDKIGVQKATLKKEGDKWILVNKEQYEENCIFKFPDLGFATSMLATQEFAKNSATAYLAVMILKHNPKVALISTLFPLFKYAEAVSTTRQVSAIKQRRPESAKTLARRTAAITILNPLPNLSVELGAQLTYNINLAFFCQLLNQNQNLDLTIQKVDGTPAPSWISMNMGVLSLIKTLNLGGTANLIYVVANYAYITVGNSNLLIIDITNPNNPILVGNLNLNLGTNDYPTGLYVQGNYSYLSTSVSHQMLEIGISTPSNPTIIKSQNFLGGYINAASLVNNKLFVITSNNFTVSNINNATNIVTVGSVPLTNAYSNNINIAGDYAYLTTSNNAFVIANITSPSKPTQVAVVSVPVTTQSSQVKGNYLFVGAGQNMLIYDTTQISTPNLVQTVYLGTQGTVSELVLKGNYIYASFSNGGIVIVDVENPLIAQVVTTFYTIGSATNSFLSNNNIFVADGGAGLTIVNAGSRVLSGTPGLSDRGLLLLDVIANDDLGNSVTDQIAIHVGDITVTPIPNQQVYVGNSTMFTFDPNTFEFPNANFTYTATLVGGLPLPSCINFDSNTRTFLFTPHSGDQNTYNIQVAANDGYGGVVSTTFNFVVPDRIPVLAQPLSNQMAYSGTLFNYVVASSSLTDADNDQLTYTANLVGSNALPGWLSFDPALLRFYGTPVGRNTYQIQLNANDEHGGVVSGTFTITVPPSAPLIVNQIGTQLASVNTPFSFQINSNTFYNLDGDPLSYTTSTLPSFLSFNNATRTFSGTPQALDDGTYTITVTATNPFGQSASLSFDLTVLKASNILPPIVNRQIPDYTITSHTPFNYTISSDTFIDPQSLNMTYTASLEGGNPLPNGMFFNAEALTLYGSVSLPQTLRITIKATDSGGVYNIDTFSLIVLDGTKYPPIVLNPIPDEIATVGAAFSMSVPSDTFKDLNGDELTITVSLSGGLPLPEWINWNPKTLVFSGTPGPFDTDTYSPRVLEINVRAADSVGSVITSFKITVQGESFWATFIKYGFSFGSVAVSALGFWKERALIWNYLCKEKYRTGTERAIVGQYYCHEIKLDRKKMKELIVLYGGKPLSSSKPYPDGLIYEYGELSGTPTNKDLGRFTVRVIDHDGYINEEFELIIKNNENEADPEVEKESSYFNAATMRLSNLRTPNSSKKEGDEEEGNGCFGKMKDRLPKQFQMRNMGNNDNTNN